MGVRTAATNALVGCDPPWNPTPLRRRCAAPRSWFARTPCFAFARLTRSRSP